ncbi:hypothetical protein [Agromyces badenianii]|uniref:hypothetical protein n=1 Tax=Agromyces badenianii TaxID=2080742 RepID=UPI000D58ECA2|nr:hypothetical protein [Agromyces badenianii]PWC05406.1 hypothetical protein DCE94_03800 [Agromyces badenianii]
MAQLVYATTAEYETLAEEPFDGTVGVLAKRLRSASIEVEKLTRRAVYETDEDGYPTDPDIEDAFTEATCAIVEYWEETDDPTGADAAEGAVKIGSVSLGTTSSSADTSSPLDRLQRRIGTRAYDILTNAGLIPSAVAHT